MSVPTEQQPINIDATIMDRSVSRVSASPSVMPDSLQSSDYRAPSVTASTIVTETDMLYAAYMTEFYSSLLAPSGPPNPDA